MNKQYLIGTMICLMGMAYTYMETQFFGGHTQLMPRTPDEVLADGIGMIVVAIGMSVIATGIPKDK